MSRARSQIRSTSSIVVGAVKNCDARIRRGTNFCEDAFARVRVHADCRFVQEQQLWLMDHTAGEIKPPLHAARERPDGIIRAIAKPDGFEDFEAAGVRQPSSQSMDAREDFHVSKCA
jgi:hypothetical protein